MSTETTPVAEAPEATVLWMRRWLHNGEEKTDPLTGLLTGEREMTPSRWHLEAPIPEIAKPFHHYQAWCGVQLGKYLPQVQALPSDSVTQAIESAEATGPDSSICASCLRQADKGQPKPWSRR